MKIVAGEGKIKARLGWVPTLDAPHFRDTHLWVLPVSGLFVFLPPLFLLFFNVVCVFCWFWAADRRTLFLPKLLKC